MSYDYKIFRINGQPPSSIEELLELVQPFDSYESSKLLLSRQYRLANRDLRARYAKAGIKEIMPEGEFVPSTACGTTTGHCCPSP